MTNDLQDGPQPAGPQLSVVIPVYNEIATLETLVDLVRKVPIDKEILLIDDASSDGSHEWMLGLAARSKPEDRIRCLYHEQNQGKTAALRTGIAAATGDIIIIQDADLEYDPAEYSRLIDPIARGIADVVYGSRFIGSPRRVLLFWHTVGNKLLTLLSNMLTNLNLTDMETCYKAFRADVLKSIPIRSEGFGFEPEITAKVARKRCRIFEVPISYNGRQYWEGKKITWHDGFYAIWTILRCAFSDDSTRSDPGQRTLGRVSRLRRYNLYLWDRISPYVGGRVLEVGSGVGNMTGYLANRTYVVATDVRPSYVDLLERTFERATNVTVEKFDLDADDYQHIGRHKFDTVACLNVLEHIEDDRAVLKKFNDLLSNGGRLVLIIPMLTGLYGEIDRALGHHRRYTKNDIQTKLRDAGFEIEHLSAINAIGIPGWWLNSRVLKRTTVPGIQAKINDFLTPLLRVEERLHLPVGMSMLVVGHKTARKIT